MRGWTSVKCRLPEDDAFVLCYTAKFGNLGNGFGGYEILFYNIETKKWENYEIDDFENNPDYIRVTYWRKLPKEPFSLNKFVNFVEKIIRKWKIIIPHLIKDTFS
jgi:hypothetical protein